MVTSLDHAFSIIDTEANVFGSSSTKLLSTLNKAGGIPGKQLALPAAFQGNLPVRPIEVLHALSYVTSPLYKDNIHDFYLQWALLRYLGFFEQYSFEGKSDLLLGVSEDGWRVGGSQRRVTSEELGVGFAAVLARRWFQLSLGRGVPIGFVDVDSYMRHSGLSNSIRPDYLLVGRDSRNPDHYRVRLLECKGTWEKPVARRQMKRAIEQLGSKVISPLPDGLAVSSITYGSQIECLAVEARSDIEASYPLGWNEEDERWFTDNIIPEPDVAAFAAGILRETWVRLADFSGNVEARRIWSRTRGDQNIGDQPGIREREEFETPYGPAVGVTETITVGDIQVSVTRAVEASVDSALTNDDPAAVAASQAGFTERIERLRTGRGSTVSQSFSAAPDGSIFFLARLNSAPCSA